MPEVDVTVIIPMLNESENVRSFFDRLLPVLDSLGASFEVIAVDDGSTDDTLKLLGAEREKRSELRILSFARNFGQHAAVIAGFDAARGKWIITIDADLQNPPEEIPKLVDKLREGHDLVNTVRIRRRDWFFRRWASRFNCWLTRKLSGVNLRDFGCMLRGYHKDVVGAMVRRHEFKAFIPALATLYARNPAEITIEHSRRSAGRSKYSFLNLLRLQLDLTTTFSISPLRALFSIGSLIAFLSMAFGILVLVLRLVYGPEWSGQGVFTLFAVLFFFVGAQFIAFGLLGEYIGRIYQEVRHRPTYLVRDSFPPLEIENGESKTAPSEAEEGKKP